jgi:polyisoprenoid-binding protein YceI
MEGIMKKNLIYMLFICTSLFTIRPVLAASPEWEMDKAHSNFYFTVQHIFSHIRGHFNEYSGQIIFDPDHLEKAKFFFEISVDSIDTNIAKRDKHLLSADFFDAGKYEKMTFASTGVTAKGDNVYDVAGKFTVKGKSYDLVLPLVFAGPKDHPAAKGKEVAGFNGTVTIDRLAYGVGTGKFYDMGIVGKEVEILVSLEVMRDK